MLIAVLGRCRLARAAVRHVACPLLRHPKFDALTISAARSGRLHGAGSLRAQVPQSMAYSNEPAGAIVAYVTVPDEATGKKLAHALLNDKLVACVNILPGVKSIYRWKGGIEEDDEQLLVIKTKEAALARLIEVVKSNHPYDEPECIALPIMGGSASYLRWLHGSIDL